MNCQSDTKYFDPLKKTGLNLNEVRKQLESVQDFVSYHNFEIIPNTNLFTNPAASKFNFDNILH